MKSFSKAFTLVEILVGVAILVIVVSIAIPALRSARTDADNRAADANAKILNDGRNRAILDGATDSVLYGNNEISLATYLVEQGYVQPK